MQNSYASGAAERGNHGLLPWLHDFECRVTSTRKPRLPAVPHTRFGGRNRYEKYVGRSEPSIEVYQYASRERDPARQETPRRLLDGAWRFVHGAKRRLTLPLYARRPRVPPLCSRGVKSTLDARHRSLDELPFPLVDGHPAVR